MVATKRRSSGPLAAVLLGVVSVFACVSGSTPDRFQGENDPSDCYTNADCRVGNECSGGICIPVSSCVDESRCRVEDVCIQGGCRVPCQAACPGNLVCTLGYCVPAPNPERLPTGGTGSGGAASGGTGASSGGQAAGGTGGASAGGASGVGNAGGFGNVASAAGAGNASGAATGGFGNVGNASGTGATGNTGGAGRANGGAGGRGGTASGGAGRGGTGGTGMAGTSTGGTGNTGPTACNIGGQHNGDGSFTWYNFAQGTGQENGMYVTACGYRGTASGTVDTVENTANTSPASNHNFVAIPAADPMNFSTSNYCGACVEITNGGNRVIATVVDMCPISSNPRCSQGAHLDVSKTAFDQLGYSRGDPSGTTWRFVPCPISGNVKVRFKTGNNNEFFVENGVTSVTAVTVNGTAATRTFYGAWHVNSAITTPATLNLTDKAGRTLTVTLNSGTSNQDTGRQFPACN